MTGRFGFEIVGGVLAFVGLWVTVDKTTAGILRVWGWWRRDRVTPLLDDDARCYPECPLDCDCSRMLEELPPERSAVDLGFGAAWDLYQPGLERRASWWEAEHRAAYESLGFDYPSGMMARVRELTP